MTMETTAQLKMGLSRSGLRPQAGSDAAPEISYASADETWYEYSTVVNLSPASTGGSITSYSVQAGSLPSGVSLNASTGAITGTPTELKTDEAVTIRATGPGGTDDFVINIEVLWYPSSLGTLIAGYDATVLSSIWQDSARTNPVVADGDPVGAWDDLSGNGNHVVQATTSAKPTYDEDGVNGGPALSFDGGDQIAVSPFVGGGVAQPWEALAVVRLGAQSGEQDVLSVGANVLIGANGSKWRLYAGGDVNAIANDTALHLLEGLGNGASSKIYLDGSEIDSGNAGTSVWGHLYIGSRNGSRFVSAGTVIAFAAIYDGDLGSTERANLKAWAVAKFGTPS